MVRKMEEWKMDALNPTPETEELQKILQYQ
jgi:hypothetical protein